eukprot:GGOE01015210.1.p1 GENE.GGOE01015210.1~~GGOE01015210.1.p1  ORF type:complete len:432 (+),score=123.70 GGOE01015210.1:91-1386(+)
MKGGGWGRGPKGGEYAAPPQGFTTTPFPTHSTGYHPSPSKGGGKGKGKGKGKGGRGLKPADEGNFYEPPPGTVLHGVYRVESMLGSGTFSRVIDVVDTTDGCHYACKVMAPLQHYLQYTSDGQKEGDLLARLAEEDTSGEAGMLRFKEYFTTRDPSGATWYCLVMERMDCSLHDFLRKNGDMGLEIRTIQHIALRLLRSAAFLHERQLTHTDIKHKNAMLVSAAHRVVTDPAHFPAQVRPRHGAGKPRPFLQLVDSEVKIIDYGNVTHTEEPHAQPIHTKQFRCPEVLLECEQWDEKSDLWCIACVLHYLYTGALLFNTHDTNLHLALIEKVLGPFPEEMLHSSRRYRTVQGLPVQRWLRGASMPQEVAECRSLEDTILPAHKSFASLLRGLFALVPALRLPASEALAHPFFTTDFPPEVVVDEHGPVVGL